MTKRQLQGAVAYITGASAGIGAACAVQLAQRGCAVFLGARRVDRLDALKSQIETDTPGALVGVCALDVRDDDSMDAWLAAGSALGPCGILINNAGLAVGRVCVSDSALADWDTMLDVNVRAALRVTHKVLPMMRARNRGDVVMMGSIAADEPYANGAVYCASKAALQAFSRALRAELLGLDIRVLQIEPGMVQTEFSEVRLGDVNAAARVYAGMRPVSADEVADCVLFALTRPRHVSLDRLIVCATDQLGTQAVHRRS